MGGRAGDASLGEDKKVLGIDSGARLTLVYAASQEQKLLDMFAGDGLPILRDDSRNLGFQSFNQVGVANEVETNNPLSAPAIVTA